MKESFPKKEKTASQDTRGVREDVYLGKWDKDILKRGVENVTLHMLKDFGGSLPDALILPETSARPLAYVLKPVFKALWGQKHIPMPKLYFFNTRRSPAALSVFEQIKGEHTGRQATFSTSDELRSFLEEIGYSADEIEDEVYRAKPEKTRKDRDAMHSRAQEIKTFGPDSRIAVIDEFASDGGTAEEIRRAFKDPGLPVYAIFGNHHIENVSLGVPVDISDRASLNPRQAYSAKLSYSGETAVGVRKNQTDDLEKYARVIRDPVEPKHLQWRKGQLRDELGMVGQEVADAILRRIRK